MAGNLTLLVPLDSDAATLSGGDWAMDLALLQDIQPTRTVQSTDATTGSTIIIIEATSAMAWSGLALGATNFSSSATIRIRAATSEANLTASPGYDSTAISAWPSSGKPTDAGLDSYDIFKTFAPGGSFVWWRIDIADTGNADGFIEIGRLYIAEAWEPDYPFTGLAIGHAALDLKNKTETGFTNTEKRGSVRYLDLKLDVVSAADAEDFLYEFRRRLGTAGDLFVCLDPEETTRLHRKMMMATAEEMPDTPHAFFAHYRTVLKFWELR